MDLQPLILEGRHVRLEPLTFDHHGPLCEVGLDSALWEWSVSRVDTPEAMRDYIDAALRAQMEGTALPFATIERSTGRVVGSTRFANADRTHRRIEIGWTWIARPWQRTAVNTEAKMLMLTHAFEVLDCIRVELKTDANNVRSRAAILRIGAREEGTLRSHMITDSGRIRDTVYFSVIAEEWELLRMRLE